MSEALLDLRGLRCPWPAIRVARAIREAGEDAVIVAVADDPAAPREIGAVATERGWRFSDIESPIGPGLRLIADRA
ncbi:sulfurtransferase TusA family protein [Sphingomonas oligoaromativorans]|uniref:sulfurtransferase TusA family protein n=1 Tax=Sphingomonas oligoaromativorans TaxID=575322 RepID=UPI001421C86E|nr:sulfurtransferase TusA family protein [Sphingomonas oligoaromativorans]NIJ33860.1 tRNA 2-thiouridine synthesizing protein A [Sphingomonas oligoaromativorans]